MPTSFRIESRFMPKTHTLRYGLDQNGFPSPPRTNISKKLMYNAVEETTAMLVPMSVIHFVFCMFLYLGREEEGKGGVQNEGGRGVQNEEEGLHNMGGVPR